MTIKAAKRLVEQWHRHLPRVRGGLFAIGIEDTDGVIHGVAVVSLPVARADMDGWTCEVTRVATDGTRNACSLLLSTARRVAQTLGWRRCLTKTLPEESGSSLRAVNAKPLGASKGGEWNRPSRSRAAARMPGPKLRWDLLGN